MANFRPFAEVFRNPDVRARYGSEADFRKAVIAEAKGASAWARYKADTAPASGDLAIEVDLEALPASV